MVFSVHHKIPKELSIGNRKFLKSKFELKNVVLKFIGTNPTNICEYTRNRNHPCAGHSVWYSSIESKRFPPSTFSSLIEESYRERIVRVKSTSSQQHYQSLLHRVNYPIVTIKNHWEQIKKRLISLH